MKNFYKYLIVILVTCILVLPTYDATAGNKDRAGQAGAAELLINPWAKSSGWGGVNVANSTGLESIFSNVAGLAFTPQTEIIFSYTDWMKGSDINIMNFGISQRISESGVLALSVMSMNFGDIDITTIDLPEGGIGKFSPSFMNINIAYSKAFSNSIYGGINVKLINEAISNATAMGFAFDVGIQYVTGEKENVRFGITLKNVGAKMKFTGDGYSLQTMVQNNDNQFTTTQRGAAFELPTQLNMGLGYDFLFEKATRFTLAGSFTSNSFTKDQISLGGEFSFRDYIMLRAAYNYEEGITKSINDPERTNANKGFSGGFTVQVPLSKEKGTMFGIDYSYRPTDHFKGTHNIAARITI